MKNMVLEEPTGKGDGAREERRFEVWGLQGNNALMCIKV
jgi:hypothetical protein